MKKYKFHGKVLVDEETGEHLGRLFLVSSEGFGKFMMLFQDASWAFNAIMQLPGETVRVLLALMASTDYCNIVPSPSVMAIKTGMKIPNLSRSYIELRKVGILYRKDGVNYLSPYLCFKGSELQFKKACKELISNPPKPVDKVTYLVRKKHTKSS